MAAATPCAKPDATACSPPAKPGSTTVNPNPRTHHDGAPILVGYSFPPMPD
jgi:hypothetical protein